MTMGTLVGYVVMRAHVVRVIFSAADTKPGQTSPNMVRISTATRDHDCTHLPSRLSLRLSIAIAVSSE